MAMLSQTLPIGTLRCPAGACREQAGNPARTGWKAMLAAFAAGALAVSAAVAVVGIIATPEAAPLSADQAAAAARWAALVREQTPRVLPPEWRWEIKTVDLDRMYGTKR